MNCPSCLSEIKKLTPQEGDVLVIRLPSLPPAEQVHTVSQQMRAQGIKSYLLVIDDDSEVYILDEAKMKHWGWIKDRPGIAWGQRDP